MDPGKASWRKLLVVCSHGMHWWAPTPFAYTRPVQATRADRREVDSGEGIHVAGDRRDCGSRGGEVIDGRRLIEEYLPVRKVSYEATREKLLRRRDYHLSMLHLWWARRPLAAARAAVYATLVPAD